MKGFKEIIARSTRLSLAGPLLLGLLASTAQTASAEDFASQYKPDALPENAQPAWMQLQAGGDATLKDGDLVVEVPGNKRHFYGLGTAQDGNPWGEAKAWTLKDQATIELRVRCATDLPDDPTFTVLVRDGTQQWEVRFGASDSVGSMIDASQWDTYRLTLSQGRLQVSSYRRNIIFRGLRSTPDIRGNALLFGSYSYRQDQTEPRNWELAFLRWTTDRADLTPPDKEN